MEIIFKRLASDRSAYIIHIVACYVGSRTKSVSWIRLRVDIWLGYERMDVRRCIGEVGARVVRVPRRGWWFG